MLETRSIITKQHNGSVHDSITLTFDQRHKRRCLMTTDTGQEFLLNLSQPVVLKKDDILKLTDGRLIAIKIAEEDVLDLQSNNPDILTQLAWTLGNMHFPMEIRPSCLRVKYDHVLENDLKSFDVVLERRQAPFVPLISIQRHAHD